MTNTPVITPVADRAVLVSFSEAYCKDAHDAILALDREITRHQPIGVIEAVPALVNLMVVFDPLVTSHLDIEQALRTLIERAETQRLSSKKHVVHVCYEPPFSPDLDVISHDLGMSTEAVINAHLAGEYHVLMYGFAPGYAYLGGLPPEIQRPRKETPVRNVPAGSVIIAAAQCLITTLTMPTGWWIIGRSATSVLTGDQAQPFLFDVGDQVEFERVDQAQFETLSKGADHG